MPSPLRSATATEFGVGPVGKVSFVWKVPSLLASSTLTLSLPLLAVTMSGRPSPLRSATATAKGCAPGGGDGGGVGGGGGAAGRAGGRLSMLATLLWGT